MLIQNQHNRKEDMKKMNEEEKWLSKTVDKMSEFLHRPENGSTHVTSIRGLLEDHHYLSYRY